MFSYTDCICDYEFRSGDRAQYVYFDSNGDEKRLIVNVVDWQIYPEGKFYVVSAHRQSLKDVGLREDQLLTNHYFADLHKDHRVALLDPDELIPGFRQLELIIDNTKE